MAALLAHATGTTVGTGRGLRLTFHADPGVAEELEALVDLERRCCAFAKWSVHGRNEEVVLDVSGASEEAISAVQAMFGDSEYRSVLKKVRQPTGVLASSRTPDAGTPSAHSMLPTDR